jgi:hypothetical protein
VIFDVICVLFILNRVGLLGGCVGGFGVWQAAVFYVQWEVM